MLINMIYEAHKENPGRYTGQASLSGDRRDKLVLVNPKAYQQ